MSYASQQYTSLWSPELYVLWVPPIWVAWVLVSWWLTLVGGLVSMAGPQSGLLPGPALCGDCQPLIGRAGSGSSLAVLVRTS